MITDYPQLLHQKPATISPGQLTPNHNSKLLNLKQCNHLFGYLVSSNGLWLQGCFNCFILHSLHSTAQHTIESITLHKWTLSIIVSHSLLTDQTKEYEPFDLHRPVILFNPFSYNPVLPVKPVHCIATVNVLYAHTHKHTIHQINWSSHMHWVLAWLCLYYRYKKNYCLNVVSNVLNRSI